MGFVARKGANTMESRTVRPIRVYADTSVFGGVFDVGFAPSSALFFDQVRSGRFRLVISTVLEDELARAPDVVRVLLDSVRQFAEPAMVEPEAMRLRDAYIAAGILTRKWEADALHVAIATVAECRIIVSWNFKHIVHFDKISLYNGVNLSLGLGEIKIHAPPEVVHED